MIKIYRYIATVKAKDPQGNKPTHYLKAKENQGDKEGEFVASLWTKEFKNQNGEVSRFLSGEMKSQWTDHTDSSKNREGFVIIKERDLNELLKLVKTEKVEEVPEDDGSGIPF
jgi:hypothetical protein